MEHLRKHFKKLVNQSDFEEAKKKKEYFLCNQLILHPKEPSGSRYDVSINCDASEIFLHGRSAYKAYKITSYYL